MIVYFCKRILYGIPVLVTVATLTFGIMHLVPGGPFDTEKKLPPEIIANIEAKYHLNEPLVTQYVLYMKQVLQGDLGPSYKYIGRDVSDIIAETFPVSITLGLCAVLVILGLGIPGRHYRRLLAELGDRSVLCVFGDIGHLGSKFCPGDGSCLGFFTQTALVAAGVMGGAAPCGSARVCSGRRVCGIHRPADPDHGARRSVVRLYSDGARQRIIGTCGFAETRA